jgi:hypothetical protein
MPSVFVCCGYGRPDLIERAANCLLAMMGHPQMYPCAVEAVDEATDLENVSVIRVFYNSRLFDRCFVFCGDDKPAVRFRMFSILNHFTQLEMSDIQQFLLPVFQSLDLTLGALSDRELERLVEIGYNLIGKGPEAAEIVFKTAIFRNLTENVDHWTWHLKVLWCVSYARGWRMWAGTVSELLVEFADIFLRIACQVLESPHEWSHKAILEGMMALKEFTEIRHYCPFLNEMPSHFAAIQLELCDERELEEDDYLQTLAAQLLLSDADP